jgi:hypothetical protein
MQRFQKKDDDLVSEFSVVTDESEINSQENVLDLLVGKAVFERTRLAQILGSTPEVLSTSAL